MPIYLLLIFGSLIYFAIIGNITAKTRQLAFLIAGMLFYYYSVYGSWFILADASGYDSGMRYYYLQDKLIYLRQDET
jgi:hypothetical protein